MDYEDNAEEKKTPLSTKLNINSNSSVQPNFLLRSPVFTPIGRRTQSKSRTAAIDELRELKFTRNEGYEKVVILGAKLSIETDFKVWCGIVRTFQEHGFTDKDIRLPFTRFAKFCGFDTRLVNKVLKNRIDGSLNRIMTQVLSFSKNDGNYTNKYHLLQNAKYDVDENIIILRPDTALWDLYQIDYTTLLGLNVIAALPRKEVAVCLYLYIQALPQKPAPVSFTRLRTRLYLSGSEVEQNRSIKSGIDRLMEIGYLTGEIKVKPGSTERYLHIYSRDSKLGKRIANTQKNDFPEEEEEIAETHQDGIMNDLDEDSVSIYPENQLAPDIDVLDEREIE